MKDGQPENPMTAAQRLARRELPQRFYEHATVGRRDGGFAVLLDGREIRTPARKPLAVPSERLAEAIAAEWQAQGARIDPAAMPLTRIVNTAIDGVAAEIDAVRADIVKFAASDLLLYRADGPEALVEAEDKHWSPLVEWARRALDAHFILGEGVMHVTQDAAALAAIDRSLARFDALGLAALHTITTLTGSAIIALAVADGRLGAEAAWEAAQVDEDWQMRQWGADETALARAVPVAGARCRPPRLSSTACGN